MNCADTRNLIHAYADGELDLVRSLEVEQHLKSCAQCAAENNAIQSLRQALRQNDLTHRAPDSLQKEIRKLVRTDEPTRESERPRIGAQLWIWRLIAAGATAFAVLTIFARIGIPARDPLVDEAIASHIRSLQANHLTDVASSDQHTVKPWFNGKLDFAPTVRDFAANGYPLIGGRLDYLDGRTVAALVYQYKKHFINVFVWPATNSKDTAPVLENERGYSVINFEANGFHYCLVSDAEGKALNGLVGLMGQ
ncbi:MAG TPA: anti-sigma factor [Verrucomicrobiae bacterium]|jgi:anti-sigma factor RsiW|nr:anti-sigma factor [Verrucomicrobiae bacterium]